MALTDGSASALPKDVTEDLRYFLGDIMVHARGLDLEGWTDETVTTGCARLARTTAFLAPPLPRHDTH